MCVDIVPREVTSYFTMVDRAIVLEQEVHEAMANDLVNTEDLEEAHEFLRERRLVLEAMVGDLNDRYILVTPFAELLRL